MHLIIHMYIAVIAWQLNFLRLYKVIMSYSCWYYTPWRWLGKQHWLHRDLLPCRGFSSTWQFEYNDFKAANFLLVRYCWLISIIFKETRLLDLENFPYTSIVKTSAFTLYLNVVSWLIIFWSTVIIRIFGIRFYVWKHKEISFSLFF